MKLACLLASFLSLLLSQTSFAASITLTPKDVAELVLKQSFLAEEINMQSQIERLKLAESNRPFGFVLKADSGFNSSKFQSQTNTGLLKTDSYSTNMSLSKAFFTGTTVDLSLSRLSDRPSFSAGATTVYSDSTKDIVGISLKQNLVRNFFGISDRAKLRSAEATFEASQVQRVSQLQNLVLDAIRSFWTAYVAQESFQEAINSRDRYLKLVATIKKKSGYGYTGPGELSQAQAELELKERTVKIQSVNYLTEIDNFLTLLKLPKGSEIKFSVPLDIPKPPALKPVKIEDLRLLKAKKLELDAKEDLVTVAKSSGYPDVSLVGRVSQQGLDENPNTAYNEMTAGTHPQYYVGIAIEHSFGSGYSSENSLNAKLQRDLSRSVLERSRLEFADWESYYIRRIQSTYSNSLSARNEKELREKAAQELNRSYTQGRTSISDLITSLNKSFESQIQFTRAVGDYQIALNEWAAFQDELIPNPAAKNNPTQEQK